MRLSEHQELQWREAIDVVAACACRLFPLVSSEQARNLAAVMLRDLGTQGIRLVRDRG
jgi:hypothetical protein